MALGETYSSGLAMGRRVDELLVALDRAFARIQALTQAVDVLGAALASLVEPEDADQLAALIAAAQEPDEAVERVVRAAARSRTHGQAALDAFVQRLADQKKGEWIPPRGERRRPGSSLPPGVVEVDKGPDGRERVWTQSGVAADDPLAGWP